MISPDTLAKLIDHTLLKPDASERAIVQLCSEALDHNFISVCVQPCWVWRAAQELEGSNVRVGAVIGFPHGANITPVKRFEAEQALAQGARELDMVINIGAVKSEYWSDVKADIAAVVEAGHAGNAEVKVILECAYLTEEEKRLLSSMVVNSGADFVKTSTGFGPHGATVEDVRLLRSAVAELGDRCGVKAAGGIRDLPTALAMLEAGATRLGTSAGIALVEAARTAQETQA